MRLMSRFDFVPTNEELSGQVTGQVASEATSGQVTGDLTIGQELGSVTGIDPEEEQAFNEYQKELFSKVPPYEVPMQRTPQEEVNAWKRRVQLNEYKLVRSLFGDSVAKGFAGDIGGELPSKMLPKGYEYVVKDKEGVYRNDYGDALPDPGEGPWLEEYKEDTNLGEFVLGNLAKQGTWLKLFSGDQDLKKEALEEILEDLPIVGKARLGDRDVRPEHVRELLRARHPGEYGVMDQLATVEIPVPGLLSPVPAALLKRAISQLPVRASRALARKGIEEVTQGTYKYLDYLMSKEKAVIAPSLIREALTGRMRDAVDWSWEKITIPTKWHFIPGGDEGRKSIAELLQPAVERLEKTGLATPFRRMQAQKALVTKVGEDLGKQVKKMAPSERFEVLSALRAGKLAKSTSPVVQGLRTEISNLGVEKSYEGHFLKALQDTIKKPRGKIDTLAGDDLLQHSPAVSHFLQQLDSAMTGNFKPRQVQRLLKEAIEDDTLPTSLRTLSRDLYNLPLQTPLAVADASKRASTIWLADALKKSGVVKAERPAGGDVHDYMKSSFKRLKGAYVPRDVELELRTLDFIPKLANKSFNKWFLTPWKTTKVIMRPGTHIRNSISNLILNDWGGLPFYRADVYLKALKEMKRGGGAWKEWERLTGSTGTFSLADIDQMSKGLMYPSNMFDHMLALFDRVAAPARSLYNGEEQWFKLAKFIWNKEHGMGSSEAALDAMRWTLNYNEVTRPIARARASAAPFFTWQAKVIPLFIESAFKHPLRVGKWWMLYEALQGNALSNLSMSSDEWEGVQSILPEYIKRGQNLLMPYRDERDRLQLLNMTYIIPGFGDVAEMYGNPSGWMLGHPLLGLGSALLSKTKFSGAPLYFDWESPTTKFAKTMQYAWQQTAPWPSLLPGGLDFKALYEAMTERPDGPTWEQAMAQVAGFKIKPIDPARERQRFYAVRDIHLSQIGSEMRKELRSARSPEESREIIEKYNRYRLEVGSR